MPSYEYQCLRCGICFDKMQPMELRGMASCPDCGSTGKLIPSMPAPIVVRQKARQMYGSGSPGKYVPSAVTGGLPIYVPSFGAMEQAEVDYVAEAAVHKERERVAKNKPLSEENAKTKQALGNVVKIGKSQKEGKRAETMAQVSQEGLR